jgi:DNA-binding response OmpR family regulator
MARILFAEDDREIANLMLEYVLKDHEVDYAPDGLKAFTFIDANDYDVIVTDYDMGYGLPDGLAVIGYAQESLRNDGALTILWSGLDRSREAWVQGINPDYMLSKSDFNKVGEVIDEHLTESREDEER